MELNEKSPDALLDLRGMLALAAVAEFGSVAAAASRLGWSHPTADHHLRRLEASLGGKLLERHPRGSKLTEFGLIVAQQARRTLTLNTETRELATSWLEHRAQRVRLGVFPTAAGLIPAAVQLATEAGIDLVVSLDETVSLRAGLEAGDLDIAVLFTAGPRTSNRNSAYTLRLLRSEPMLLATPSNHPHANNTAVQLSDFAADRWAVGASDHDPVDSEIARRCETAGFSQRVGMRSDDYRVILQLVAEGLFVAAVPASVVAADDPRLRLLPFTEPLLHRDTVIATGRRDPAIAAVISALRQAAGEVFRAEHLPAE